VLKAPGSGRDEEKGALSAFVRKPTDGTEVVLRTLEAGLKNIAGQYPDLVGIDYMQRRGKSC
jgi:hypothetical protein